MSLKTSCALEDKKEGTGGCSPGKDLSDTAFYVAPEAEKSRSKLKDSLNNQSLTEV